MSTDGNEAPSTADAASASEAERFEVLDREAKVDSLVKNHVMMASAASLVPVPLFDVAAIMAIQLRLIARLAEIHGKTFSENAVRNTITGLMGGAIGHGAGILAAISVTKFVPGFGWMLAAVSLPVVAGAMTYALGQVYVRHFQSGGSVYDISVESARAYYREQLKKGRRLAGTMSGHPSAEQT